MPSPVVGLTAYGIITVLTLTTAYPAAFPLQSKLISIAPAQIEYGQTANIFTFSVKPVRVCVETLGLNSVDAQAVSCKQSEPFGDLYRTVLLYDPPIDIDTDEDMTNSLIKIRLRAEFVHEVSTAGNLKFVAQTHTLMYRKRRCVVFIETDKPGYIPNEIVHLSVTVIHPVHWSLEEANNKRTTGDSTALVRSIQLHDSTGGLRKEWTNLTEDKARKLSFELPGDAVSGRWNVTVFVCRGKDHAEFTVLNANHATPTVSFHQPRWFRDPFGQVQLGLCANTSLGDPAYGTVKMILCNSRLEQLEQALFREQYSIDQLNTTQLFSMEAVYVIESLNYPKPCSLRSLTFDEDGCVVSNFTLDDLAVQKYGNLHEMGGLILCTEFFDPTEPYLVHLCDISSRITKPDTEPFALFPDYYKYGLPIKTRLQFTSINFSGRRVSLTVTHEENQCSWTQNGSTSIEDVLRFNYTVDEFNGADVILPPIFSSDSIRVLFHYHIEPDELQTDWKFRAHRLKSAHSFSKEMIQFWPSVQNISIGCARTTRLTVMGNTPLSNKQFLLHAFVRGTILPLNWTDVSDGMEDESECINQDGPLGHFQCLENRTVSCLPGWRGPHCLQLHCSRPCLPLRGFCSTGDRCECIHPWYGESCYDSNTINTTSTTTEEPTGYFDEYRIYQRTIQVNQLPDVFGSIPLVLFYIKTLESDLIEAISTHVNVIRSGSYTCGLSTPTDVQGPGVYFKSNSAQIGSTAILTIVTPVKTRSQQSTNDTVCQVRVWDERMLRMWSGEERGRLLNQETFQTKFQPEKNDVTFPKFLYSSYYELWSSSVSQSYATHVTEEPSVACENRFPTTIGELVWQPVQRNWTLPTMLLFESVRPAISMDGWLGAQYNMSLPPIGRHWKASVFCFGKDLKLWSATSETLVVQPAVRVRVFGASKLKLYEIARIDAVVEFGTSDPTIDCYDVRLNYISSSDKVTFYGPSSYSHCVCAKSAVIFTTWIAINAPGMFQLIVDLHVTPEEPGCERNFTRTGVDKVTRRVYHTISSTVEQYHSTEVGILYCMNLSPETPRESIRNVTLVLPPFLPNNTRSGTLTAFVSYSGDVVGPLVRNFNRIASRPVSDAYDNLALVYAGANVLKHLHKMRYATADVTPTFGPRTHAAVVRHFNELSKFLWQLTPTGLHMASDRMDLRFAASLYETLGYFDTYNSRYTPLDVSWRRDWRYSTTFGYYPWKYNQNVEYATVNLLRYFIGNQDSDGCFGYISSNDTASEDARLPLSAHMFIVLQTRFPPMLLLDDANKTFGQMLSSLKACLMQPFPEEISDEELYKHDTQTLAYLAHAMVLMDPMPQLVHRVLKTLASRSREELAWDGWPQTYWTADEEEVILDTAMEVTMHVYMALAEVNPFADVLVPIVRWITNHQNAFGEFPTSKTFFAAAHVLFDFSYRVSYFAVSRKSLDLEVSMHWASEQSTSRQFWQGIDRDVGDVFYRYQPGEPVDKATMTFDLHDIVPTCIVGKAAYLYLTEDAQPNQLSVLQEYDIRINHMVDESCRKIHLVICSPRTRSLILTVHPQSGWEISDRNKLLLTSYECNIALSDCNIVTVNEFDRVVVKHEVVAEGRDGLEADWCFEIPYTQMGYVQYASPLEIFIMMRETSMKDNQPIQYRLPDCGSQEMALSHQPDSSSTPLEFINCPQVVHTLLSELDGVIMLLKEFSTQPMHAFQIKQPMGQSRYMQVYRVDNTGLIGKWNTSIDLINMDCVDLTVNTLHIIPPMRLEDGAQTVIALQRDILEQLWYTSRATLGNSARALFTLILFGDYTG
ncbi:unnamed protein product [Dicrocoelium dendriticum]|nr:unnamed protein product [Dicrocoelium dendriticum]